MLSQGQFLTPLFLLSLFGTALSATACAPGDDGDEPAGSGGAELSTGGANGAGGLQANAGGTETGAGGTVDGAGGGEDVATYCRTPATCPPSIEGVDMTTVISFRTDLYPTYFGVGCGDSGCHNSVSNAADLSFVNKVETEYSPLSDAEISTLIAQLTTDPALLAPAMKNVVAGDWENSFLMMKLDGCQNSHGIVCDQESQWLNPISYNVCDAVCGGGMPLADTAGANFLPFATTPEELAMVNKVRAWIAQGALDN